MKNKINICLEPFAPKLGNIQSNIKKIEKIIEKNIEQKIDVIVFPELALTGYLLENLVGDVAIRQNHKLLKKIKKLSKHIDIYLGFILEEDSQFFNAVAFFSKKELQIVQKKLYPPTYGMFDEIRYVSKGSSQEIFESKLGKTGILICEDAWHPLLAYNLYMAGAKHIIVVSASPNRGFSESEEFTSVQNWKKRLEVYAESFGVFLYYVNRSGIEDGLLYGGHNYIVTPTGRLCENGNTKKKNNQYSINLEELRIATKKGGPFQEENWQLNKKLFNDSFSKRER